MRYCQLWREGPVARIYSTNIRSLTGYLEMNSVQSFSIATAA